MTDARRDAETALRWLARLQSQTTLIKQALPPETEAAAALARLIGAALDEAREILVVVADDAGLAPIANAVEIALRPLCLILPAAEHVRSIAQRASLSLLASRLARDDDGDRRWQRPRQKLAEIGPEIAAQADYPTLARIFPARVLPRSLARQWAAEADWVVVADGQDDDAPWPGAQRTLLLAGTGGALTVGDRDAGQRAELDLLTQELADLELELATAQAEIAGFTDRYHALIGARIARLDALQAELAARQAAADADNMEMLRRADQAHEQARRSQEDYRRYTESRSDAPPPFRGDADLKRLFRTVAQKIHPDRARSEDDRAWRTQLMSEANRAYRANDRAALQEILSLWAEGAGRDSPPDRDAADRDIARLKKRIGELESELKRLFASKLYELFTAAGIAGRAGRDLLQEMAERLDEDIRQAEFRLA
jgi:Skp family chaperone for outer membrane proteins